MWVDGEGGGGSGAVCIMAMEEGEWRGWGCGGWRQQGRLVADVICIQSVSREKKQGLIPHPLYVT